MNNIAVKLISHKGKEIIFLDLSIGETQEHLLEMFSELEAFFNNHSEWNVLYLVNAKNVFTGPELVAKAKQITRDVISPRATRAAVFGATPIQRILLKAINTFSKLEIIPFDSKEDAMDYLVKD